MLEKMKRRIVDVMYCKRGTVAPMEMIQVAILITLAVALGLIFRTEITTFINKTFQGLNS